MVQPTIQELEAFAAECWAALEAKQPCQTLDDYVERLNASLPEGEPRKDTCLAGMNLEKVNLKGANLAGVNLRGAILREADLWKANLMGANLEGVNLTAAKLWLVNLKEADLKYTNLSGANLMGANLMRADLEGANLEGTSLLWLAEFAELEGANLINVKHFPETFVDYRNNAINTPEQLLNLMRGELAKPSPDKDILARYRSFTEGTLALDENPDPEIILSDFILTEDVKKDLTKALSTIKTEYYFSSLSPQDKEKTIKAAAKCIPEIRPYGEKSDANPVSVQFKPIFLEIMANPDLLPKFKDNLLEYFQKNRTLLDLKENQHIEAIPNPKERKQAFNNAIETKLIEILSMGETRQISPEKRIAPEDFPPSSSKRVKITPNENGHGI